MSETESTKSLLRREMGLWDVLLFNIAAILGPRWIAAAAHNGTSSISLWVLAAVLFFLPTALIIVELSTRFPSEGGLYVWSKEAFGDFHGFVAGWSYWAYTVFYFPGLLTASVAMSVYIGGPKYWALAKDPHYLLYASLGLLAVAVILNLVGLNIGKWLQNAGGVATYAPLLMLLGLAAYLMFHRAAATQFTFKNSLPTWNLDTVNFWSQIAFAFTGLELVCTMSEEVKDPRRTLPRAIFASAGLIAGIYLVATVALLWIMPGEGVDVRAGVFQAISSGSTTLGIAWFGVMAALLVTIGNAGGVGATVAGVARVPFVAGIDRYLPSAFGKIHPRWRTPYVAILTQAGISGLVLALSQYKAGWLEAYQILVDAAVILYFIPFLYIYAAAIKLAYRKDRAENPQAVLVPGGKPGIWLAGLLGFIATLGSIVLAMIPPGGTNRLLFEGKLIGATSVAIAIGLALYWRGARSKALPAPVEGRRDPQ
ncbi:MAG TPA: APC family permease [Candidatus Saccharimonadales bacterium]|nr:APC family permease [Candidatus Saccharimonadales bacterium]